MKQIETRTGDDGARDGGEIAGSICIADNKSTLKDRDLSIGYWYGDESTDGDSADQDDFGIMMVEVPVAEGALALEVATVTPIRRKGQQEAAQETWRRYR